MEKEMNREEIIYKLNDIFRDVFDDQAISVKEGTTSEDIDGWDSLLHITLIAEIEDAFNIKFPMKEVISMKNLGEMIDFIQEETE